MECNESLNDKDEVSFRQHLEHKDIFSYNQAMIASNDISECQD